MRGRGAVAVSAEQRGPRWLEDGGLVFATSFLHEAWRRCEDRTAGLLLAWLHHRLEVPSDLPAEVMLAGGEADVRALIRDALEVMDGS